MTISVRTERALSAQVDGFRDVHSAAVAVSSVIGTRSALSTSLRSVTEACVDKLQTVVHGWARALPSHRVFVFAAATGSDQQNAMQRRRGVWGSEGLSWLSPNALRSPSIEMRANAGLRFIGLAQIESTDMFEAVDYTRTHSGSFLFMSKASECMEESARSIAQKVLPSGQSSLDWAAVISGVEHTEEIRIRASGSFDDREVALDAFLSCELLLRLDNL